MKYCRHCGTELDDNVKFCSKCGKDANSEPTSHESNAKGGNDSGIVKTLSERLQLNGIIWIIIGAVQILVGGIAVLPIAVGAYNIYAGVTDLKNSKRILDDPTGIYSTYEPIAMPIVILVCNLILGGVIGVAGSIYHLVAIRQYVVEHKDEFLALEN